MPDRPNCKCNASEVEEAGKEEKRNEIQLLPLQPHDMIEIQQCQ